MRLITLAPLAASAATLAIFAFSAARAEPAARISGPFVHENLSVYFVHGTSTPGPVPLTLQEALAKGGVTVVETKSVNELKIENTGTEDVFIQAGDIVKGGQQDRVLTVSLVLPPKSGQVPIASFCVEQGRWSARGREDVSKFSSSADAMPSREAKLAMAAPAKPAPTPGQATTGSLDQRIGARNLLGGSDISERQQKVWREVASTQDKLSAGLNERVAAAASATSLQLALENDKLKGARVAYTVALGDKAKGQDDVIGYVFVVNGRINSADIYPSNGLFQKMWPKLLAASVTEAIGEKNKQVAAGPMPAMPAIDEVQKFLAAAEAGTPHQQDIAKLMRRETRDAKEGLYTQASRADGAWVHRNYLAK